MRKVLLSAIMILLSAGANARVCKLASDLSGVIVSDDGGAMWQVMMNRADLGDFAASGMAFCSSTSGSAGAKGAPSTTAGTNCWCKITSPTVGSWVSAGGISNVSAVNNVSVSAALPILMYYLGGSDNPTSSISNARVLTAAPTTTSLGFCNANCSAQCAALTRTNATFRAEITAIP